MLITEKASCVCRDTSSEYKVIASGWDFEYETTRDEHRVARCSSCQTVFLHDRPVDKEMSAIYPSNYYSFSEAGKSGGITAFFRNKIESGKAKSYQALIGENKPAKIIDIGCGDGRLLDILSSHVSGVWSYSGIEIDPRAVEGAKSKGYDVVYGNFETNAVPWMPGTFDLALMHQVIEHTREPREVLRRTSRILKPGGYLSIETPDVDSWDFSLFSKRYWGGYHLPRHFYMFKKKSIARLLEEEGFEVVRMNAILSPVFWIHSVHNWLVDRPWGVKLAKFFHYQNPVLLGIATIIELLQIGTCGTSSNMQIIARKK